MNEPDPILGWRLKPGRFRYPGYTPAAPPISVTLWPGSSRATSGERLEQSRHVVIIGDSFSLGWAISDDETYAWKLHARFPDVEFVNYGTGGYNGVQALLRLEQHLATRAIAPELVVYGFNEDQERRNVAEGDWLELLTLMSRYQMVRIPYCLPDGRGGLTLFPPTAYPTWPLRQRLALVATLEKAFFRFVTRHRGEQKRAATELLIDRMSEVLRGRGSRLLVVLLQSSPEFAAHYAAHLGARAIAFLDCRPEGSWLPLMVPGQGHPNGLANTKWADCIARFLEPDLGGPKTANEVGEPTLAMQ